MNKKTGKHRALADYDNADTTQMIERGKPLQLKNLGLSLPPTPPTQVVSIRLPTALLNRLKAIGSQMDIPYQALIKLYLSKAVRHS